MQPTELKLFSSHLDNLHTIEKNYNTYISLKFLLHMHVDQFHELCRLEDHINKKHTYFLFYAYEAYPCYKIS